MKKIITMVLIAIAFSAIPHLANAQHFPYTLMDGDRYDNKPGPSDGIIQLIDSSYHYSSRDGSGWILSSKDDDFVYENNLLVNRTTYTRSNGSWLPDLLLSVKRNLAGDPDSTLVKKMSGGNWVNENLTVEEYNELHLPTFYSYSLWQGFWKEFNQENTMYDSFGKILSRIVWDYDSELGITVKKFRDVFNYNSANRLESAITSVWLDTAWAQVWRVTYYYNAEGRYDSVLVEVPEVNGWGKGTRFMRTYNADSALVTTLWQEFQNGEWVNYNTSKSYFDDDGRFSNSLHQSWTDNEWQNVSRDRWGYDNFGNVNMEMSEQWVNERWETLNISRYTYDQDRLLLGVSRTFYDSGIRSGGDSTAYYFQKVLGFEEGAEDNLTIYPNPASDYFAISSGLSATRIEIYDSHGRPVKFINSPGKQVDVTGLASGMYLVRIIGVEESRMVKMVKIE